MLAPPSGGVAEKAERILTCSATSISCGSIGDAGRSPIVDGGHGRMLRPANSEPGFPSHPQAPCCMSQGVRREDDLCRSNPRRAQYYGMRMVNLESTARNYWKSGARCAIADRTPHAATERTACLLACLTWGWSPYCSYPAKMLRSGLLKTQMPKE